MATNTTHKVNLNKASKEELMQSAEGIGEETANDLICYREQQGGIRSYDELRNIGGISEVMIDKIRSGTTLD